MLETLETDLESFRVCSGPSDDKGQKIHSPKGDATEHPSHLQWPTPGSTITWLAMENLHFQVSKISIRLNQRVHNFQLQLGMGYQRVITSISR